MIRGWIKVYMYIISIDPSTVCAPRVCVGSVKWTKQIVYTQHKYEWANQSVCTCDNKKVKFTQTLLGSKTGFGIWDFLNEHHEHAFKVTKSYDLGMAY